MDTLRVTLIALLTVPVLAGAQPAADHLKCYKVRDPAAKRLYTADLGGLVAEPGCTIKVPAAMACVPATKTNVQPDPPGGGGSGTPNAFACYKIKCPRATLPPLVLNDQFGTRAATPIAPKLVCAPLAPPPPPTTTTVSSTSTTSNTTTTAPPCNCPSGCGCLYKCETAEQVCVTNDTCAPTGCSTDAQCGPGNVCVGPSPNGCVFIGVNCCQACP